MNELVGDELLHVLSIVGADGERNRARYCEEYKRLVLEEVTLLQFSWLLRLRPKP